MAHRALFLVMFFVTIAHPRGLGCSCAQETVVAKALAQASVVFTGVCTEGRLDESKHYTEFTFRVSAGWKGAKSKQRIKVETSGDCGYPFEIGGIYIVYCNGRTNSLETDICTRTRTLSDKGATEEMAALRRALRHKAQ